MKTFFALIIILLLFVGCTTAEDEYIPPSHQTISATEAYQMMTDGNIFVLLDVRTEEEFADGHIAGAILIPISELQDRVPKEIPDRDMRILIYCRSGRRSAEAAQILAELGYTRVYDFGGILDWSY